MKQKSISWYCKDGLFSLVSASFDSGRIGGLARKLHDHSQPSSPFDWDNPATPAGKILSSLEQAAREEYARFIRDTLGEDQFTREHETEYRVLTDELEKQTEIIVGDMLGSLPDLPNVFGRILSVTAKQYAYSTVTDAYLREYLPAAEVAWAQAYDSVIDTLTKIQLNERDFVEPVYESYQVDVPITESVPRYAMYDDYGPPEGFDEVVVGHRTVTKSYQTGEQVNRYKLNEEFERQRNNGLKRAETPAQKALQAVLQKTIPPYVVTHVPPTLSRFLSFLSSHDAPPAVSDESVTCVPEGGTHRAHSLLEFYVGPFQTMLRAYAHSAIQKNIDFLFQISSSDSFQLEHSARNKLWINYFGRINADVDRRLDEITPKHPNSFQEEAQSYGIKRITKEVQDATRAHYQQQGHNTREDLVDILTKSITLACYTQVENDIVRIANRWSRAWEFGYFEYNPARDIVRQRLELYLEEHLPPIISEKLNGGEKE